MDNPLIENKVREFREAMGSRVIYKQGSLRTILKRLAANEPVYLLIDQNTVPREGVFVDFFANKASADHHRLAVVPEERHPGGAGLSALRGRGDRPRRPARDRISVPRADPAAALTELTQQLTLADRGPGPEISRAVVLVPRPLENQAARRSEMRANDRPADRTASHRLRSRLRAQRPGLGAVRAGPYPGGGHGHGGGPVPPFLKKSGRGWITAEYAMLPGSSGNQRIARERGKINNRSGEIQRFIGRALRTVLDLKDLGERTITLDADVIQADGGTRCASLNASFLALVLALKHLVFEQVIADFPRFPLHRRRVHRRQGPGDPGRPGLRGGLAYRQRHQHRTDDSGALIEVQSFCEGEPLPPELFQKAIALGSRKEPGDHRHAEEDHRRRRHSVLSAGPPAAGDSARGAPAPAKRTYWYSFNILM